MNQRTTEEILIDLKDLIFSKGYIYSLCLILFEDFHHDLDKIHQIDYRSKLSVKECSLLIGFLVQKEIDFTFPQNPVYVLELKDKTYALMEELHWSYNYPQVAKITEMLERKIEGEDLTNTIEDKLNFFAKDGGMVEPMFYSGDGVYDFQYLEYLDRKYKYDKDWLLQNRNFKIDEIIKTVKAIKATLQTKSSKVNLIGLKESFPLVVEKVRKKLKKQYSTDEITEIENDQFVAISFYQYKELFPIPINGSGNAGDAEWHTFYENLIDLFVIKKSDIEDNIWTKSFFSNFSFSPVCNEDFNGAGYFNILNSRPLIKLDNDRFFIPIGYLIPEAVYESPYYWMCEDTAYRNKLSKNRGAVGEEIAFDLLSKVFGVENTYKSILATTKKGEPDTDIDVLCILGSKALCVQVKSKKLTMNAKRGSFDHLTKDFNGAVQDAYNQGLVSRNCILKGKAVFKNENGDEIQFKNNIDEVYIMGLTTENYPSLTHQVHLMLDKKENEPYPLVISSFDLELLVHYLPDPYDFLYYVRQRINLIEYFRADEELIFLGYHLHKKLWKVDGYDGVMLDTDYGAIIDRNYYPYKTGLSDYLSKKNDPIGNIWKDPKFDKVAEIIKTSNHNKATDIIFNLLDWSAEKRKGIVDQMIIAKTNSKKEFKDTSIATTASAEFGFSYQVLKSTNLNELDDKVLQYSTLKKYQQKCNNWLGLGSFANSSNLVDFMLYLDEPWVVDSQMQEVCLNFFKNAKGKIIQINKSTSIGRNDLCPCKSGIKYKRCCGV